MNGERALVSKPRSSRKREDWAAQESTFRRGRLSGEYAAGRRGEPHFSPFPKDEPGCRSEGNLRAREGTGSEGKIPPFQAKSQRLPETHQFPGSHLAKPPRTFRRGLPRRLRPRKRQGFLQSKKPSLLLVTWKARQKAAIFGRLGGSRNARNKCSTLQQRQSSGTRAAESGACSIQGVAPTDLAAAMPRDG
jgi:hypothetical protein